MGGGLKREPSALRKLAGRARLRLLATALQGDGVTCECCGRSFRRFAAFAGRADAQCPACGSLERHRLLLPFLRDRWAADPPGRLLHFAPEPALSRHLPGLSGEYVTSDLEGPADLALDICDMDVPGASFDAIICSHVLEHVADDRRAMAEMHRALRPGGEAIVLVPIYRGRERTEEDPSETDPAERLRRFGQHDHVRAYGPDVAERLEEAGFAVQVPAATEGRIRERIHVCVKPQR